MVPTTMHDIDKATIRERIEPINPVDPYIDQDDNGNWFASTKSPLNEANIHRLLEPQFDVHTDGFAGGTMVRAIPNLVEW